MTADHADAPGADFPRYPRVLVAVDGSPATPFLLRHVVPYVVQQRSRLTLATVVVRPHGLVVAAGVSPEALGDELEDAAARLLRRLADGLPHDLSVTTLVRRGDPATELLALLRDDAFDVLCLGARGRGRMTSALLGSVSGAVLHRSPVPVLVVHEPAATSGPS